MERINAPLNLPALLLCYQRPETSHQIIADFLRISDQKIYVHLDYPKSGTPQELLNFKKIQSILGNLSKTHPDRIVSHVRESNMGCAASVLSSLDWFFYHVEQGVILEDDCIPSDDFYTFAEIGIRAMKKSDDILLTCGTQFAPKHVTDGLAYKSQYILTWGWATTRENWVKIKRILVEAENQLPRIWSHQDLESRYWSSGARRAYQGFVDVWDTVLVNAMRLNNYFALLPGVNLVTNVGSDSVATHTKNSLSITLKTEKLVSYELHELERNFESDKWLRERLFKIRRGHSFTNRISNLRDLIIKRPKFSKGLIERWKLALFE